MPTYFSVFKTFLERTLWYSLELAKRLLLSSTGVKHCPFMFVFILEKAKKSHGATIWWRGGCGITTVLLLALNSWTNNNVYAYHLSWYNFHKSGCVLPISSCMWCKTAKQYTLYLTTVIKICGTQYDNLHFTIAIFNSFTTVLKLLYHLYTCLLYTSRCV